MPTPALQRRGIRVARSDETPNVPQLTPANKQVTMMNKPSVIHSDADIMGGTPVFRGTRVPFQTLMDYLEAGHPLENFLDDFPTVSRVQAIAALEEAKDAVLAHALAA